MKKILILVTASLLLISSQAVLGFSKNGNGNVIKNEREVTKIKKIVLNSIGNVYVKQGTAHYLRVDTDSNLQENIKTEIHENVLYISIDNPISPTKLNIFVTLVDLEKVKLEGSGNIRLINLIESERLYFETYGSGNIEAENISAEYLSIEVRGSGDVDIEKLKTDKLDNDIIGSGDISIIGDVYMCKASIMGTGDMFMEDCKTGRLKAKISGTGDIMITIKDELLVDIFGSGDVYYKGNPSKLKVKSMGSGEALKI